MKRYTTDELSNPTSYATDESLILIARKFAAETYDSYGRGNFGRGAYREAVLSGQFAGQLASYIDRLCASDAAAQIVVADSAETLSALAMPDGFGARIDCNRIVLTGPYLDTLPARLRRLDGVWDGNAKCWILPIAAAKSLKRVFGNAEKQSAKISAEKSAAKQAAAEKRAQEQAARENYWAQERAARKPAQKPRCERFKIIAGTVQIGGTYCGHVINGLGKPWTETVDDSDACAYGIQPGLDDCDRRVTFQYAYTEAAQ